MCRAAAEKRGRPALKHKVILSSAEDKQQPLSFLLSKFCEKYNAQADVSEQQRLAPDDLQLRLGEDNMLRSAMAPLTNYVSDYNDLHVVFAPVSAAAAAAALQEPGSVLCTNFGCGKRFVPGRDDVDGSCTHHAGRPVFHDTYKYWSCCPTQKSMEFADFEKVPGCARGVHKHDPVWSAVAVAGSGGGSNVLDRKPLTDEELQALESKKRPSANAAAAAAASAAASDAAAAAAGSPVQQDAPARVCGPREFSSNTTAAKEPQKPDADGRLRCRRNGCQKKFRPEENHATACSYHTQGPVFHDARKYWMCCPKNKCDDFADFEKVPGCAVGEHLA